MALGTGDVVPAAINVRAQFSQGGSEFIPQRITMVPKNPDGTVYDTTSATSAAIFVTNPLGGALDLGGIQTTDAPTLVTHDATKLVVELSAANELALAPFGSLSGTCSITVTDGTTTKIVAIGSYTQVTVG